MNRIPIIINDVTCGEVQFRREGAYMVCCGRAERQGDVVRLWLYGKGERAYLGIVQPDGTVRRRFSLGEFSRLPNPIEYCADRARTAEEPTSRSAVEGDVLWVRQPDGTLLHWDGRRRYVAFPADGVRLPRGGAFLRRCIEGREYVIFPW